MNVARKYIIILDACMACEHWNINVIIYQSNIYINGESECRLVITCSSGLALDLITDRDVLSFSFIIWRPKRALAICSTL